jgi:PAS domain S-box-containing protein
VLNKAAPGLAARRDDREVLLTDAVEHGGFGFVLLDDEGRIVHANRAACELVGRDRADIVGNLIAELVHPDHRGWSEAEIGLLLAGAMDRVRQELPLLAPDGSSTWAELHARPSAGANARVAAIVLLEQTGQSESSVPPAEQIELGELLGTVAELGAASPGLVAWELYTDEQVVRGAWTWALRRGLLDRARYDHEGHEWLYELTSHGRAALRELQDSSGAVSA